MQNNSQRPKVIILVAAAVDGRISLGPNRTMWDDMDDVRGALPGEAEVWAETKRQLYQLHQVQASMLGSNSLVGTDDQLVALPPHSGEAAPLYSDFVPPEVISDPHRKGWLVVVDGRGRCRSGYQGEDGWQMLHLVSHAVAPEYLAFLQQMRIPYLIAGERRVDLEQVLAKMHAKLGVTALVNEAGGNLAGAMLRAGLVDEVNVIVRPIIIGGKDTPSLFDSPDLLPTEMPVHLQLVSAQILADSDHLWLRYRTPTTGTVPADQLPAAR